MIFQIDQNSKYNNLIQIIFLNVNNIMLNHILINIKLYVIIMQNNNIIKSMNKIKNIFNNYINNFDNKNFIQKILLKK